MKATRKMSQRNAALDLNYYTTEQVGEMIKNHEVFVIQDSIRVGINPGDKVEVVDDGYGYYATKVTKKEVSYFISL